MFENAENWGISHINMYFQIFLKHQLTPHGSNHLSWITDASLIANNTDTSKCRTLFHIYSTNLTLKTTLQGGYWYPPLYRREPWGPEQGPLSHQSSSRGLVAGSLLHTTADWPSVCHSQHQGLFTRVCHLLPSPQKPYTLQPQPPTLVNGSVTHPAARPQRLGVTLHPSLRLGFRASPSHVAGQFWLRRCSPPTPLFTPLLSPGVLWWPSACSPCFRSSLFVLQLPERCF